MTKGIFQYAPDENFFFHFSLIYNTSKFFYIEMIVFMNLSIKNQEKHAILLAEIVATKKRPIYLDIEDLF